MHCKPDTHLTAEPVAGDVVHLPRRLFERLFGDFEGGVLGITLRVDEEVMYATAAPSAEQGDDIYVPLWMAAAFEQRTFRDLEVLDFTVDRAEPVARAALIVVRQCVEMEMDVRDALELFLYDCRYVHANTVLHVGGCEVWVERVIDSEGFEVAVAELGPEVSLDIQGSLDDGGRAAEATEAARVAEAAREEAARLEEESKKPIIPDAATIRAQRLKFFETQNKKNN
jgi:hypothetical protein